MDDHEEEPDMIEEENMEEAREDENGQVQVVTRKQLNPKPNMQLTYQTPAMADVPTSSSRHCDQFTT